jgi:hypothetical protein
MSFLDKMELRSETVTPYGTHRNFKGIQVGEFVISVQASVNHYCTPRKTLPLEEYSSFEIALFDKSDDWINPHSDYRLKEFPRLEELLENYEDANVPVGGHIDKDLIEDLYTYLNELNE